MSTTTQTMTADELLFLPKDGMRYELVRGELKQMAPAGFEHGIVIAKLTWRLGQHVETHQLGVVCGAETGFKISSNPDTVRAPDIAFVSRERLAEIGITKKFWAGAPNLAVEVLSPGDTVDEVGEKVEDWLAAGTKAVWIVSSKLRNVTVYRSLADVVTLTEKDELSGHDVVPDFRCKVAKIFV
jgi:Uma2 family endonuclease